jgi:hypothetical protein
MKSGFVFCEFAKRKLTTRKDKIKIIKSLPLVLSVSREERCEVLACFHVIVFGRVYPCLSLKKSFVFLMYREDYSVINAVTKRTHFGIALNVRINKTGR